MWRQITVKATELIRAAESMKGLNAEQKRARVISALCGMIKIPLLPKWAEGLIEPALYGAAADALVMWWNIATKHELKNIPAELNTETEPAVNAVKAALDAGARGNPLTSDEVLKRYAEIMSTYLSGKP